VFARRSSAFVVLPLIENPSSNASSLPVIATFLPRPDYSLLMMCFGMFVYVQLNLRWTIPMHNVDAYTSVHETALKPMFKPFAFGTKGTSAQDRF